MIRNKKELAFGVIPGYCRYELYTARYYHMAEVVKSYVDDHRGPVNILDLGSGEGVLKLFCNSLPVRWVGVENHTGRAGMCRGLGYEVHELDLDKDDLPFRNAEFQIIVASHIIEHLDCPGRLLRKARQFLAQDGIFILGVPMHTRFTRAFRLAINPAWEWAVGHKKSHKHFFTLPMLLKMFGEYKVEEVRGFRFFSTRKYLPLENSRIYFNMNYKLGRRFPGFTPEVNVVAR